MLSCNTSFSYLSNAIIYDNYIIFIAKFTSFPRSFNNTFNINLKNINNNCNTRSYVIKAGQQKSFVSVFTRFLLFCSSFTLPQQQLAQGTCPTLPYIYTPSLHYPIHHPIQYIHTLYTELPRALQYKVLYKVIEIIFSTR